MSLDDRLRLASLGMHPDRTRALLADWGGAAAVLRAVELGQVEVSAGVRERLKVDAAAELANAGATAVTRDDLPVELAGLPDAPDLVYVRGELPTTPAVAVVGSRAATSYGRRLARSFGRAAAEHGWVVVSGLARGIDGEAHRGCLDAGGVGVAVLGCGVDVSYPPEHEELAASLVGRGGALVSEYAPGTPPAAWRFPTRNRRNLYEDFWSCQSGVNRPRQTWTACWPALENRSIMPVVRYLANSGRRYWNTSLPDSVPSATSAARTSLCKAGSGLPRVE